IETGSPQKYNNIRSILGKQVNATAIHIADSAEKANISLVIGKDKFYIHSTVLADHAGQKEQLEKDLAYQKGFLVAITKKFGTERLTQNARREGVALERKKLADAEAKIKAIEESLARMD